MKGAINLTMQKKSKLLKKAASIDELPIEENPFFLAAAEDDGQEDEEPIQEIAQELDGQLESEDTVEPVHIDDFVIPMAHGQEAREQPGEASEYCGSLLEEAEPPAEEEIFAVLENQIDDEKE